MPLLVEGGAFKDGAEIVPVPLLPSFCIGDNDYVLLIDIQTVFNIRQDYALAILAQNIEEDIEFLACF